MKANIQLLIQFIYFMYPSELNDFNNKLYPFFNLQFLLIIHIIRLINPQLTYYFNYIKPNHLLNFYQFTLTNYSSTIIINPFIQIEIKLIYSNFQFHEFNLIVFQFPFNLFIIID